MHTVIDPPEVDQSPLAGKQKLLVILVLIVALILPLLLWSLIGPLSTDSCDYLSGAKSIALGQGYRDMSGDVQTTFPPGYSFTISAFMLVFKDPILAARVVSFLAAFASVLLVYLIASRFFDRKVGLIASFVYACLPIRIISADIVFSESLYVFLVLMATWLWIKGTDRPSWHLPIFSGVVFGYAYLVRPEGLLCGCCLYLLSLPVFRLWKHTRLRSVICALCSLVVVALPYMWFIHQQTGTWSVTPKYSFNQRAAIIVSRGKGRDPLFRLNQANTQIDQSAIPEHPLQTVKRYSKNIYHAYNNLIIVIGGLLFSLPIITLLTCSAFLRQIRKFMPILIPITVLPLIYLPLFFVEPRFVMVVVIPWIMLASIYLSTLPTRHEHYHWVNPKYIMITLVVGIMGLSSMKDVINIAVNPTTAAKTISISSEIRQIVGADARIMSSYPVYVYYARSAWQRLPYDSLHRTILYARNTHTNYIIFDDRSIQYRDMDKSSAVDKKQISLVKVINSGDGDLHLYKLN